MTRTRGYFFRCAMISAHAKGLELQVIARIDEENGIDFGAESISHPPTPRPKKSPQLRDESAAATPRPGGRTHIDRQGRHRLRRP